MDLEDLKRCTVRIDVNDEPAGTGFFVANGLLVTCAHVVLSDDGRELPATSAITLHQAERSWAAKVDEIHFDAGKLPDIAFLKVDGATQIEAARLDTSWPLIGDHFSVYGFPDFFPNGESSSSARYEGEAAGNSSNDGRLVKIADEQIRPGLSGSPVLNTRTGRVCAMMKSTRDRNDNLGGYAIASPTILWHRRSLSGPVAELGFDTNARAQRIHKLRLEIETKWALTFLGEDDLATLGDIAKRIASPEPVTVIPTKFAYWGPMPTYNWLLTCSDPLYSMLETIQQGSDCVDELGRLKALVRNGNYTFVSLGIGDGKKDAKFLKTLYARKDRIVYCPVELSLEMLWTGRKHLLDQLRGRLDMPMALHRDIESPQGLRDARMIIDRIDGEERKIYSLLGNTITNTDDPPATLSAIGDIMRPNDVLLLETWGVEDDRYNDRAMRESIRNEYLSTPFRMFALSGLSQNTDLPIDYDDPDVYDIQVGDIELFDNCHVLAADTYYMNATKDPQVVKIFGQSRYTLRPTKCLRIVRSLRFTSTSLQQFFRKAKFQLVETASFPLRDGAYSTFSVLERAAG
jgi:hypothetical protein